MKHFWPFLLIIVLIRKKIEFKSYIVVVTTVAFLFILIVEFFDAFFFFPGGQNYFLWYLVCFLMVFVPIFFNEATVYFKSQRALNVSLVLLIAYFTFAGVFHMVENHKTNEWLLVSRGKKPWDERAGITKNEIEAMNWLNKHTSNHDIIVSDRIGFNHESRGTFQGRWFGYSAFSGRQFYNEGDDFNQGSIGGVYKERQHLVKKLLDSKTPEEFNNSKPQLKGTTHLILSKRFWTNYEIRRWYNALNVIYENTDIAILKL
jgi:hypothetical protein